MYGYYSQSIAIIRDTECGSHTTILFYTEQIIFLYTIIQYIMLESMKQY